MKNNRIPQTAYKMKANENHCRRSRPRWRDKVTEDTEKTIRKECTDKRSIYGK